MTTTNGKLYLKAIKQAYPELAKEFEDSLQKTSKWT